MSKMKLLAAVAGVALVGSVSQAATVSVTQSVPSAAAIANDPTLAGDIVNDLVVTLAAGEDWTNNSLRLDLTTGSIYNAAALGAPDAANSKTPQTLFWGLAPATQFDTFVAAPPNFNTPTILGGNTNGTPAGDTATDTWTNTVIGVAYGDLQTNAGPASFTLGRFTLTPTSTGTFKTTVIVSGNQTFVSLPIVAGAIGAVPEPTSVALLAGGVGLVALRRRRQA